MNNLYKFEDSEVEETPIEWPKKNPFAGYYVAARANGKSTSTLLDNIMKLVAAMWDYMYKNYPNRRVVHLARHAKHARARNKNRNRILRYFKKEVHK